jgi:DNA-binding NtrC family response regulator
VTTDERVRPEAEACLGPDYELRVLHTWDELKTVVRKELPDAIFLDIDTVEKGMEDGIAALAELRSLGPDLVLVALTRSNSRNLRLKAVNCAVDEYFVAPINFEEVRIILGRLFEKRTAEIEYRNRHSEEVGQQCCGELIGGSEPMQRLYEAIRRVADSASTVLIRGEAEQARNWWRALLFRSVLVRRSRLSASTAPLCLKT